MAEGLITTEKVAYLKATTNQPPESDRATFENGRLGDPRLQVRKSRNHGCQITAGDDQGAYEFLMPL